MLATITKKIKPSSFNRIILSSDPSFPSDGAVELVFARGEGSGGAAPAPTPAAPRRAAPDALARADSLEHLRPLSSLTDDDPGE